VTQDLFFVADGTGGHVFAPTYEQHLENVARWRAIERRRAGLPPERAPEAAVGEAASAPTGEMAPDAGAEVTILPPGQAPR
jgi:UPF0755 protein